MVATSPVDSTEYKYFRNGLQQIDDLQFWLSHKDGNCAPIDGWAMIKSEIDRAEFFGKISVWSLDGSEIHAGPHGFIGQTFEIPKEFEGIF